MPGKTTNTRKRLPEAPEWCHRVYDEMVRLWQACPLCAVPLRGRDRYRPFFIVGCVRSGTTLLRRVLEASPVLHIPPETYALGSIIKVFRQNRGIRWHNLVDLVLARLAFHPEFHTFEMSLGRAERILLETPRDRRSLACILNAFYVGHAREMGKECERWGDKTPFNVFHLERIRSVFPDAQFVHLVRNGVDVVASCLRAGVYEDVDRAAKRWVTSVRLGRRFVRRHPSQCLTVRYEDLVGDPDPVVSQIFKFLDVRFDADMLGDRLHVNSMGDVPKYDYHSRIREPIDAKSVGKGYRDLSPELIEQVERLIGPELVRLGYRGSGPGATPASR